MPYGPATALRAKALEAEALLADEALTEEEEAAAETDEALLADEAATDEAATDEALCADELAAMLARSAQKPTELMLAPAASVLFQPMPDTVTVLPLCDQPAFHSWLILPLASVKLPRQPSTAAAPVLVTVMAPQKPAPHSLVMR